MKDESIDRYDGPAMLSAREDFDRRAAARHIELVLTEFSDAAHLVFSVSHRPVLARVWNQSGCGGIFDTNSHVRPTRLIGDPNQS